MRSVRFEHGVQGVEQALRVMGLRPGPLRVGAHLLVHRNRLGLHETKILDDVADPQCGVFYRRETFALLGIDNGRLGRLRNAGAALRATGIAYLFEADAEDALARFWNLQAGEEKGEAVEVKQRVSQVGAEFPRH